MISAISKFETALDELGIKLNNNISNKLYEYYELLIEANSYMNLTAITEPEDVFIKHFADSLTLLRVIKDFNLKPNFSIIDIGCGAGFPSIPLKIAMPEIKLTSIDSTGKKIEFIHNCIEKLQLKGAVAIKVRAEELAHSRYREHFDVAVSRAVARLSILAEYGIPLIRTNGFMVAYKAASAKEELKECESTLKALDSKLCYVDNFVLPYDNSLRNNIIIRKLKKTDKKYPRTYGQIKKNPL